MKATKFFSLLAGLMLCAWASSELNAQEVYTEFDESTGTLTYYYDNDRNKRSGTTEPYTPNPGSTTGPQRFKSYNLKVLKGKIDPSMKKAKLESFRFMFYGGLSGNTHYNLQKMTSIEGLENLNTLTVKDMYGMFMLCSGLEELNLSSFNTIKVTNFQNMFMYCSNLKTLYIDHFDVRSATTVAGMFARCSALETIYCSSDWSESSATAVKLFTDCENLSGEEGTSYNDTHAEDIAYARPDRAADENPGYFSPIEEIYTVFDESTGTLTYLSDAYRAFSSGIAEPYNPYNNLRFIGYSYEVQKIEIPYGIYANDGLMSGLFYGGSADGYAYALNKATEIVGLWALITGNVTDMSYMFYMCSSLTSIDISSFDMENVSNMHAMFGECKSLQSVNLGSFKASNLRYAQHVFSNCPALETIYCSSDWSAKMSDPAFTSTKMFSDCESLKGFKGTAYDPDHRDATYARMDGVDGKPGYFTPIVDESYAVVDKTNNTFTLYYDPYRLYTEGSYPVPFTEEQEDAFNAFRNDVKKVIFDESFRSSMLRSSEHLFLCPTSNNALALMPNVESVEGLEHINTSIMRGLKFLFAGFKALKTVDLTQMDFSMVYSIYGMFSWCEQLTTIYCNEDLSDRMASRVFEDCYALVGGNGTPFDAEHVDAEYARPDKDGEPGYFTATMQGVESIQMSAFRCQKVLRNGQLYLMYEGKMYDVQGRRMK